MAQESCKCAQCRFIYRFIASSALCRVSGCSSLTSLAHRNVISSRVHVCTFLKKRFKIIPSRATCSSSTVRRVHTSQVFGNISCLMSWTAPFRANQSACSCAQLAPDNSSMYNALSTGAVVAQEESEIHFDGYSSFRKNGCDANGGAWECVLVVFSSIATT